MNLPLAPGDGSKAFRRIWSRLGLPAIHSFAPDLILVSAGFDAHRDDPLAGMGMTEGGYADLTGIVAGIAKRHAQSRILSCLEGGYNQPALASSVDSHIKALLDA